MWVAVGMAAVSAVSAYDSNQRNNAAMDAAAGNASRRYQMQANISEDQMDEQQIIARGAMTDITRQFLQAKGTAKAIQAETMVGGNVAKRATSNLRLKESEAKGKVASEVNVNIINIAQGMIANKIDTDALVSEALSKKRTGLTAFTDVALAGMQGGLSGMMLTSNIKALNTGGSGAGTSALSSNPTDMQF